MVIIKKILSFIGQIGKCLSFIVLLFALATLCISIKLSYENEKNPFCSNKYENEIIILEYENIESYDYYFDCSTLYFELNLKENMSKNQVISLLMSIGNDLSSYDCFTHFQINSKSFNKTLYATINLKTNEVSLV